MMRRLRHIPLLLALLFVPLACDSPFASREEFELIVLEQLTECTDLGMMTYPCLNVIRPPQPEPQKLYEDIEGFTFELGVRQRIIVARYRLSNPPLDGSAYEYRLVRLISRQFIFVPVIPPTTSAHEPSVVLPHGARQ